MLTKKKTYVDTYEWDDICDGRRMDEKDANKMRAKGLLVGVCTLCHAYPCPPRLWVAQHDMSDHHDHGNCDDESHHHDHQHHLPEGVGPRDNLYTRIDRDNVIAFNAQDPGKGPEVIKPWDSRLDEAKVCLSPRLPCETSAA